MFVNRKKVELTQVLAPEDSLDSQVVGAKKSISWKEVQDSWWVGRRGDMSVVIQLINAQIRNTNCTKTTLVGSHLVKTIISSTSSM